MFVNLSKILRSILKTFFKFFFFQNQVNANGINKGTEITSVGNKELDSLSEELKELQKYLKNYFIFFYYPLKPKDLKHFFFFL